MEEIWKNITGYEGLYQVSNLGRVRSLDRMIYNNTLIGEYKYCFLKGKILKPRTSKSKGLKTGYYRVMLYKDNKGKNYCIHKLVAQEFLDNPEGKTIVDHIDGNVANNRWDNLRWVTQKENVANPNTRRKLEKYIKHWYKGEAACNVAISIGINLNVYRNRIHLGWSPEKTIETPVKHRNRKK